MADQVERKTYRGRIELKADSQQGEFRAEFATLNVIDHDQDVTEPGAFQDGQETLIEAWNHDYRGLPVGKGIIREEGDKATFEGRFFLDTESGLEHYKTVKNLGSLQEWSYTFQILDSKLGQFEEQDVRFLTGLDVWGIAPVQRGVGIDTRTVDIKSDQEAAAAKVGARHTGKEYQHIQQIHDLAVELGAKCAEPEDSRSEDEGKRQDTMQHKDRRVLAQEIADELLKLGTRLE